MRAPVMASTFASGRWCSRPSCPPCRRSRSCTLPAPEQGGSDKKDDGATSGSDSNKDDNAISSDDKNPDASKDDVKTADVYHVMGYSVAFTMALAGIVLLVYEDRKKKRLINK